MTPAEKRELARSYAELAVHQHPKPTRELEVEIADHFLMGLRLGLVRGAVEEQKRRRNLRTGRHLPGALAPPLKLIE